MNKYRYFSSEIRNNIWVFILLVALHGIFFFIAIKSGNIYLTVDSTEYLHQAENIRQHHSWYAGEWKEPLDNFLKSRRPPLYGFFLYVAKAVVPSDYWVLLVQNLLSIFSLMLTFFLTQHVRGYSINGYYFFLPLIFFLTQLIYANMIMADVLFQFFLLAAVFLYYRWVMHKAPVAFLGFNLMITLAILTKPVMYLFGVVIAAIAVVLYVKRDLKLKHTFFAAIPCAVVMLISCYNYHQTGWFHYSSVNQKFISEYGAYLSVGDRGSEEAQRKIDSLISNARAQPDFKSYSHYLNAQSEALVRQNFGKFMWAQMKGNLQFFIDHGRWDLYAFFKDPDYVQTRGMGYYFQQQGIMGLLAYLQSFPPLLVLYLMVVTMVNIFLIYCLFRFFRDTSVPFQFRLMVACLIFYQVIFTSVVGCSRYRMAIYPLLLMAYGIYFSGLSKTTKVHG